MPDQLELGAHKPRVAWQRGRDFARYELVEGEVVSGRVVRLPAPGEHQGNRLFLRRADGVLLAIPATASKGHAVLNRALEGVSKGDEIQIRFLGWRDTLNGERRYRLHEVIRGERS